MESATIPYFLYALGILMREGFEAMLVVLALAAGVRQLGERRSVRGVYLGAIVALGMSVILAWVVNHWISDDASDSLEGAFQLAAAATLFYVSSWLTAKSQAGQWRDFINTRLESSRQSSVPAVGLALTAFLAVMREGAETIVFFQALLAGASAGIERHAIVAGVIVASLALACLFVVLRKTADRIPLRWFFAATSGLLYLMAVIFVGQGIATWQEAGLVSATFVSYVPTIKALGLFPTLETLVGQALLGVVALAAVTIPLNRLRLRIHNPSTI